MFRFGDPGKGFGFGRFGGIDETQWCPVPSPSVSFTPGFASGVTFFPVERPPLAFEPVDPTQPVAPCIESHEAP